MISGRLRPEIGGSEDVLDVMGLNYYVQNQWIHNGAVLVPSHPQHLPVRYMVREVWERYGRPIFIAETGIEGDTRPEWLRYIAREGRAAIRLGVPLEGICWYPILNHPGWEDDRHCPNGLWDYADASGGREIDAPAFDSSGSPPVSNRSIRRRPPSREKGKRRSSRRSTRRRAIWTP